MLFSTNAFVKILRILPLISKAFFHGKSFNLFFFLHIVAFVRSDKPKLFRGLQIKVSNNQRVFVFSWGRGKHILRRIKPGGNIPFVEHPYLLMK